MKATELVKHLTDLISKHGDQVVMNEYGHVIDSPEFNDDGTCFLVSFDDSYGEDE